MRGAGGTDGGILRFVLGLAMILGGGYLFLNAIRVTSGFYWGMPLYEFGGFALNTGMILIPFMFGIGIVFYDARNPFGWILTLGSLVAVIFGVLQSLRLSFASMSFFDLLVILVLLFGGIGLFLSSLRDLGAGPPAPGR